MEVYSHRGIGLGPENTHSALKAAVAMGLHLEVDVNATRDAVSILLHDSTLERTTDGKGAIHKKLYREIQHLSAGTAYEQPHDEQEIPLAEDALIRYGPHAKINLDLKKAQTGIQMLKRVTAHNLLDTVLFTSTNIQTVKAIKEMEPAATVGAITERYSRKFVAKLAKLGIEYIAPWVGITSADLVKQCDDHGIRVLPWFNGSQLLWTPEMDETIERMASYNVSGIIVNHPHEVLEKVKTKQVV